MTDLQIILELSGSVQILRIEGRMDAVSSPALESKLIELMRQDQNQFLLDFSRIKYLSSAGMRVLLSITKKLKERDGKLAFFAISDEVMEIIKMAGFEKILSIYKTEAEALKALQDGT
jgi:anti-sigma B factor antagonist/stage II sporulation protein AA (anti-sigma F factor antagonist)